MVCMRDARATAWNFEDLPRLETVTSPLSLGLRRPAGDPPPHRVRCGPLRVHPLLQHPSNFVRSAIGSVGGRAQRATDGRNRKFDRVSLSEHFLEPLKNGRHRVRREATEPATEPLGIDGPELIQCDETRSTLKATRYAPGIGSPARRHRHDDHGAQVLVQLVRRNDEAGAGLLDLAARRGIQPYEVHFAAGPGGPRYFHSHSSRSKRVAVNSSKRPSAARSRMTRAAFAQPVRGRRLA